MSATSLECWRGPLIAAHCLLGLSTAYADSPPVVPRPSLTPGAILPSCTLQDICPHERPGLRGTVSASLRNRILRNYGVTQYCSRPGACELDHSVPVELCGATAEGNLWPQSYLYREGARMKDALENRLHDLACAGTVPLPDAQKAFKDWLAAHVKYGP